MKLGAAFPLAAVVAVAITVGTDHCPSSSQNQPQHTAALSALTPHQNPDPADTAVNEPLGAPAAGTPIQPQQRTSPRVVNPQVFHLLAVIAVNESDGAPETCPFSSAPQHTAVPPAPRAHECPPPADTETNEPLGASVTPPALSWPQQRTSPPVVRPHEW